VYVYRTGPAPGVTAALAEVLVMAGPDAGSAAVLDSSGVSRRRGGRTPSTSTADAGDDAAGGAVHDGVAETQRVLATDPDLDVRTRSIRALARIGTPEALEALGQGLADPEITVRLSAVNAIASFSTPRARTLLRGALGDRDEQVREVAAATLHSLRRAGR
jgi:hypothetical protein